MNKISIVYKFWLYTWFILYFAVDVWYKIAEQGNLFLHNSDKAMNWIINHLKVM